MGTGVTWWSEQFWINITTTSMGILASVGLAIGLYYLKRLHDRRDAEKKREEAYHREVYEVMRGVRASLLEHGVWDVESNSIIRPSLAKALDGGYRVAELCAFVKDDYVDTLAKAWTEATIHYFTGAALSGKFSKGNYPVIFDVINSYPMWLYSYMSTGEKRDVEEIYWPVDREVLPPSEDE